MAKLIYINNVSLDGFFADAKGSFNWGDVQQVHEFITEMIRPVGTHLYGRRLYETMAYWDSPIDSYAPNHRAFAEVWQKAEKIVFSRTLPGAVTRSTRVEREFDPEAIRKLRQDSATDITIGGAELAGVALDADLLDECHLFVHPVILGNGKPAFRTQSPRNFELLETRQFSTGTVHARYRVGSRD